MVIDEDSKEAICVDPYDADMAYDFLKKQNLNLKYIINTHEHFDHIRGNDKLVQQTGAALYSVNGVSGATKYIKDQFTLLLKTIKVDFFHTPGHTMNHISFIANQEHLFCGDMLFNAGVGRCSNGGDVKTMYQTFETFYNKLPGKIKIYPGHDYIENNLNFAKDKEPENKNTDEMLKEAKSLRGKDEFIVTTLEQERSYNPFLRLGEEKIKDRLHLNKAGKERVFKELRSLRDQW